MYSIQIAKISKIWHTLNNYLVSQAFSPLHVLISISKLTCYFEMSTNLCPVQLIELEGLCDVATTVKNVIIYRTDKKYSQMAKSIRINIHVDD